MTESFHNNQFAKRLPAPYDQDRAEGMADATGSQVGVYGPYDERKPESVGTQADASAHPEIGGLRAPPDRGIGEFAVSGESLDGESVSVDKPNVLQRIQRRRALRNLARTLLPDEPLEPINDPSYSYVEERTKAGKQSLFKAAEKLVKRGDPQTVKEVMELTLRGTIDGIEITPVMGKWRVGDDIFKRSRLLEIYELSPETARLLVCSHIGGFHGSASASLVGVLRHGALLSGKEASARQEIVTTGEQIMSPKEGQAVISFADYRTPTTITKYSHATDGSHRTKTISDLEQRKRRLEQRNLDTERQYGPDDPFVFNNRRMAEALARQVQFVLSNPGSEEAALILDDFPVAYGLDISHFDIVQTFLDLEEIKNVTDTIVSRVPSDIEGEFWVVDKEVSLSKLPVIAVPEEQIERVKKLLHFHGISHIRVIDIKFISGQQV